MTAFLKIDTCRDCGRHIPWEWAQSVVVAGRPLAGTGVWRSQLVGGICPKCQAAADLKRQEANRVQVAKRDLIQLLGGEKPYREFTFDRYEVSAANQLSYERASQFNPAVDNLYLWGACGVGKTHLAYAIGRRSFQETLSVVILRPLPLNRNVRMKDPDREQATIEGWVSADVLVLDDLGSGPDTAFNRQVLQEILDGRAYADRAGLVVTSSYSLGALAEKMKDDAIASRLAGLCSIIEVRGSDRRLGGSTRNLNDVTGLSPRPGKPLP